MEYDFIEVIGSQETKPETIDVTSSQFYVYERKDIEPYQEQDENGETLWEGWKYKERKIPKEEWQLQQAKQNKEKFDALMLGLVDLYELQIGEM